MTRRARCPHCHKPVAVEPEKRPADYPFCCERCRLLDLNKWFQGDYSIPTTAHPEGSIEGGLAEAGLNGDE